MTLFSRPRKLQHAPAPERVVIREAPVDPALLARYQQLRQEFNDFRLSQAIKDLRYQREQFYEQCRAPYQFFPITKPAGHPKYIPHPIESDEYEPYKARMKPPHVEREHMSPDKWEQLTQRRQQEAYTQARQEYHHALGAQQAQEQQLRKQYQRESKRWD